MRILFLADIIGEPGRDIVRKHLPALMEREHPDVVIANAENAAGGKGITAPLAREFFAMGVNALTLGNHTFDRKKEIVDIIEDERVARPANYPPGVAGAGIRVIEAENGKKIAVISLMGRVYLPAIDCPFRTAMALVEQYRDKVNAIFVDFHAEITSEKQALGWYLDGRVSAVVGTHTHVQTADEKILPQGTAYLTDAGMCGPTDSVIGMDKEVVLTKYLTGIPQHFVMGKGSCIMQGCIVETDDTTGHATAIRRVSIS